MNRLISILILILCCITIAAQPRLRQPEIYFGGHAGIMASTVLFKPSIGLDLLESPLSPNGGLIFRYAGHKVCAIQVELNYMQRGWKETIKATTPQSSINYLRRLHYIEIPLLMHLYFGKKHTRGFINLGPQIGYCFLDEATGNINPDDTHQYITIQNKFDWGLAGGIGIYYRTNNIGLFQLEARFNYSFGSIFNNRKIDDFEFSNPMNLSLNLAYLWEFKNKR